MHAISRLPNELLSEIFLRSALTGKHMHDGHPSGYSVLLGRWPTNITQVSRLWRDVAISTPRLWSRISTSLPIAVRIQLNPQLKKSQVMDTALRQWTQWLERSSASPLFLELDFDDLQHIGIDHRESVWFIGSMLHTLLDHVHRVQDLTIYAGSLGMVSDMPVPRAMDSLALLGKLSITGRERSLHYRRGRAPIPFTTSLFERAPRLRRVSIHAVHMGSEVNVPYSQLTHLDIHGEVYHEVHALSVEELASALNECPHLITLQIRTNRHDIASPHTWQMPILPSLQHLLINSNPGVICTLLDEFSYAKSLPAVKRLTISCSTDGHKFKQSLETFFDTYAETICELSLGTEHKRWQPEHIQSSYLRRSLKAIPRLLALSLYGYQSDASKIFMDALSFRPWPPTDIANAARILEDEYVPFLSCLTVTFPHYEFPALGTITAAGHVAIEHTMSCLAAMVDSRWRVPDTLIANGRAARLRKLRVSETQWRWMVRHAPDAYERIKACVDEGLQLSFDIEKHSRQDGSFEWPVETI